MKALFLLFFGIWEWIDNVENNVIHRESPPEELADNARNGYEEGKGENGIEKEVM